MFSFIRSRASSSRNFDGCACWPGVGSGEPAANARGAAAKLGPGPTTRSEPGPGGDVMPSKVTRGGGGLAALVLAALLVAPARLQARGAGRAPDRRAPDDVFIIADDLGWRDTSLYGSTFYRTPNIERLAKRGMMFMQAYAANPLCSP